MAESGRENEGARLRRLIEADRRHLWHPFTPMDEWESEDPPLIVERGEGAYLIDIEGRRYLDGVSSLWVNIHGHRRAEIDEAAWASLYSTKSRPFDPPETGEIAVKVINHYGDEVLKVYEV